MSSIKVMLIDDNPANNLICRTLIKMNKLSEHIEEFLNAQTAFERLEELSKQDPEKLPDLIFLDLNMPIMDGWEFLDCYKKLPASFTKECKVFILTSSIYQPDIQRAAEHSYIVDLLSKPLTEELLNVIYRTKFLEEGTH